MICSRLSLLLTACLVVSTHIAAEEPKATRALDPVALETAMRDLAPKLTAATVGIVLSDDDIEPSGVGYGGSGVIVSADGLILTAAHVLEGAGGEVIVLLPERRKVKAKVRGSLGRGDLGVIQLIDAGPWTFLPMASVERVPAGTPCLGAGHTGRIDPQRPPPVRAGRVLGEREGESFVDESGAAADLDRVLVTDAPFLPGDSGGPLVNLTGEVIGVHSSIGPDHRENLHVPIWQFKRHWEKLTSGVRKSVPQLEGHTSALERLLLLSSLRRVPVFDHRITVERSWSRTHANYLKKLAASLKSPLPAAVEVFIDDRPVAYGAVASAEGHVVTLADVLASGKIVCRIDGKDYPAKLLRTDPQTNLALLQAEGCSAKPVEFSSAEPPDVAAWIITVSPTATPLAVGIRSLPLRPVPKAEGADEPHGFLGIELQTKAVEAKIGRVFSESAAATAGVRVGDTITSLNGNAIRRGEELVAALRRHKPGEVVELEVSRGGTTLTLEATLGTRPSRQEEDDLEFATWNRSSGGVSRRKDDFPPVLAHDSFLAPRQCGGPVVDLRGRVVGLNLARVDRTATLLLPAAEVRAAIERMRKDAGE
jgi:serine protease Do